MPPDRDFERELEELGAGIEYPPTPDLARAVRNRLDEEEDDQTASRGFWSRLPNLRWTAAAAAFLLIIAVPSLSPGLRDTIDGWLTAEQSASGGSEAARGAGQPAGDSSSGNSLAESAKDVLESGSGEPSAGSEAGDARSLGKDLGLGERISLKEAQARTSGGLLLPGTSDFGEPDEVYAPEPPQENGFALVYRARHGLPPLGGTEIGIILTERPGEIETAYLADGTMDQPGIEKVSVRDERGYWVPSGRRLSTAVDRTDGLRGSVLLWEQEGLALRMETNLPKEEAVRIASSVR